MIGSFVVIFFSAALLMYWFRYTCILLVRNGAEELRAANAAVQKNFNFGEIQDRIRSEVSLDPLHQSLQRDYQILTYLVRHASNLELESFEERMLVWDYKLMRVWYGVTKTAAPERARAALSEMASVLSILAGRIGQRAGLQSQA
jgi:hypothetical protein